VLAIATVDDAFDIAQSLTPAEQIALISRIWEAVPKTIFRPSDADLAEMDRRWAEYEAGRIKAIPWEEVRKTLRKRLKSHEQ
jgi:putative addiction module component (TIGR02574 family)